MWQPFGRFCNRFGVWIGVAGIAWLLAVGGAQASDVRELDWEELVPGGYTDEYVENANAVPPEIADHSGASMDVPADAEVDADTDTDSAGADAWTKDSRPSVDNGAASKTLPDDFSFEDDPTSPMALQYQDYRVVDSLHGQTVRIPGFVVPFDLSIGGDLEEFLLVPYFGACIHVPPPPPNQIVFVKLSEARAIDNIWDPFWVEGVLHTERYDNDLGSAAYTLQAVKIEPYEY